MSGDLGNTYLLVAVLLSAGAQVLILYNSFLANMFQTMPLTQDDWILVALFSIFPLFAETVLRMMRKAVKRHLSLLKV